MNLSQMNQARELKARMDKIQEELSNTIVEASSGKGAVKVTADGQQKIKSITISPGVIDPDKAGVLEELVVKAVSEALTKSQKAAASKLKSLTGGLKMPGLF
ncbi:MAG: YbaB/EbfC family nucleoid-associated protein [Dehalococcoidales bacterium]|nr:YbaB/EbfC family nucleoid-associated protein [Dehalococcoidales bacterium]